MVENGCREDEAKFEDEGPSSTISKFGEPALSSEEEGGLAWMVIGRQREIGSLDRDISAGTE